MKHLSLSLILFLCLSLSIISHASPSLSTLNKGSSLRVEHHDQPFLTSQDQTFSCGFYSIGTNTFVFSIWFSKSINKTIVWTAIRDSPVNGYGSEIFFQRDGNFVLKDINGSAVWSTSTASSDVSSLSLLNTGNLVINDTKGNIKWQSFDSPTDTLLPYQNLTKDIRVVSAKTEGQISSGYYILYFDNDNVLRLKYDGPELSSIYWPSPDYSDVYASGRTNYNSTRRAFLDDRGYFASSDDLAVSASDFGPGVKRRLTVDYDGNLRMYSLNEWNRSWHITWEALPQQCNMHGICGQNAICNYSPSLMCSCVPGHEMIDATDWNKGCKPKFSFNCDMTKFQFLEVPQVDFYGFDLSFQQSVSFDDCVKICTRNCSCMGFSYRLTGTGVCYPKGALFNGYKSPNFPGSFYLRLPLDANTTSMSDSPSGLHCTNATSNNVTGSAIMFGSNKNDTKWTYLYIFISVLGSIEILFIAIGWWYLFRASDVPESVEEGYKMISNQFRRFTYRELKEVTGKFKEEIGRGGSGIVYRGVLDDKRVVAVKKLTDITQGEEEFWGEVSVIGQINHINLARMCGYCLENQHRLLVYEYVENESLDKYLSKNDKMLQWRERFKIALGSAKGLAYLHHECLEWIIHCDVKPENILLTRDYEPKIADFGLVKLSKRNVSGFNFSQMRGTIGYMAPEWVLNLPVTSKVDVYSFGVVLLEIVMGCRVSDQIPVEGEEREIRSFIREVRQVLASGDESSIFGMVDVKLRGQFSSKQAMVMLRVAISCLEEERNRRPTMDVVVKELMACEQDDDHPSTSYSWSN
ncbi:hypothetical protein LUZ60_008042 [Juncus effusus]|nr:hypothetical protein LUZ60_008042 [Juncus effusus]